MVILARHADVIPALVVARVATGPGDYIPYPVCRGQVNSRAKYRELLIHQSRRLIIQQAFYRICDLHGAAAKHIISDHLRGMAYHHRRQLPVRRLVGHGAPDLVAKRFSEYRESGYAFALE